MADSSINPENDHILDRPVNGGDCFDALSDVEIHLVMTKLLSIDL